MTKDVTQVVITLNSDEQSTTAITYADGQVEQKPVALSDVISLFAKPPAVWLEAKYLDHTFYTNIVDEVIFWYPPQKVMMVLVANKRQVLHVPMPGLIFHVGECGRKMSIYAYKGDSRPDENTVLYHAPLGNVHGNGGLCFGSQERVTADLAVQIDPIQTWHAFWEAGFNGHGNGERSKQYKRDIRLLLIDLHETKEDLYPADDLIEFGKTAGELV